MPGLINDTAAFDPVEYYTKQLPLDLARLTELRDELRKRQGAMTAVGEAQKDRDAAAAELQSAKDQAAKLMAEAKEQAAKNAAKAAQLNDREKAVEQADAAGRAAVAERKRAVDLWERNVGAREAAVTDKEQTLAADVAKLDAEKTAFNAKVAAFQSMAAQMKA